MSISKALALSALALVLSTAPALAAPAIKADSVSAARARLDATVPGLLAANHTAGAGVAVIRGGKVVWTGYWGVQAPGVPAGRATMFNTASLAKTITAQTTMRLAAEGRISLDEPIWRFYVHPDLATDPRYKLLTPRLILSHRTGLLNWSYMYKDGKLAFVAEPGTRFGYSGAGYEMLAHFLEKKLGVGFEDLVRQEVFAPAGITGISLSRHAWMDERVTTPMDHDGHFAPSYRTDAPANPDHPMFKQWSAAADLFATVEDYARFLVSVMDDDGLTPELARQRLKIASPFAGDEDWRCDPALTVACPTDYGFGLGWMVFRYSDQTIVFNGGNDSGENALVYFSPKHRGDGMVVFVNGGAGMPVILDIVDIVDPHQKLTAYYRGLIAHYAAKAGQ